MVELMKIELDKLLDARSKWNEGCHRCMETLGSVRALFSGLSEGPSTDKLNEDERIYWCAYSTNRSDLLTISSHKKLLVKGQIQKNQDILGEVLKNRSIFLISKKLSPSISYFLKALNHPTHILPKNSALFDNHVANKLHQMTKKTTVLMNDPIFLEISHDH